MAIPSSTKSHEYFFHNFTSSFRGEKENTEDFESECQDTGFADGWPVIAKYDWVGSIKIFVHTTGPIIDKVVSTLYGGGYSVI